MTYNKIKMTLLSLSLAVFLTNSPCATLANTCETLQPEIAKNENQVSQVIQEKKVLVQTPEKSAITKNAKVVPAQKNISTAKKTSTKLKETAKKKSSNVTAAKKTAKTTNTKTIAETAKVKPEVKMASKPVEITKKTNNSFQSKVNAIKTNVPVSNSKPIAIQDPKKINFKTISSPLKERQAVIYIGNREVIRYTQTAGGYSPEARAKILVYKLQKFVSSKGNPKDILPGLEGRIPVGRVKTDVLFTVDKGYAKELSVTQNELVINCVNNIREALGAPKISRDFGRIASRSGISVEFARKTSEIQQNGIASWYGGKFHGRRAADGSRFSKHEFTAAHKTLPLGTFVKVTNKNNLKSCVVKITDRGPFVPGRIIDVSRAAANHLDMLGSGISNVQIEVVDSF